MPATMLAFCDLPDPIRFRLRDAITDAGGEVAGYYGPYVQVAIPRPAGPFFQAMEDAGLELDEHSLSYFPLGTDKPPESLRHDGRYPQCRGFWLYGNFSPRP
jgi:hypothetical protein